MTERNAHDDERNTADLAAGDAVRPQEPADQLTPAGSAVSPSPSPTPTFAATDRPARRARRLRWKPGITRPMMALSAASFALMVAGVGSYVSAIPAVVSDKPSAGSSRWNRLCGLTVRCARSRRVPWARRARWAR